jgi:hypothetical protein
MRKTFNARSFRQAAKIIYGIDINDQLGRILNNT